jgi:hypothetical protein
MMKQAVFLTRKLLAKRSFRNTMTNNKSETLTIRRAASPLSRATRFAAILCAGMVAAASPGAALPPKDLLALYNERTAVAQKLVGPIAVCVTPGAGRPAFQGCVDWHSSVSGIWALIAYSRAVDDHQYDRLVQSILTPENIAAERKRLAGNPRFELPYGRAWFLRLSLEYKRRFGGDLLAGMSSDVFNSLMEYYKTRKISPSSDSYDSDSWALINMYDYARSQGDEAALQVITDWISESFAKDGAVCKTSWEGKKEFMAVCANWAWLTSHVLRGQALRKWADGFFRGGLPKPVAASKGWPASGLNFSRAWGLWRLYQRISDNDYAEAYAAHFRKAYGKSGVWRKRQGETAQFGMFALQPLFGGD